MQDQLCLPKPVPTTTAGYQNLSYIGKLLATKTGLPRDHLYQGRTSFGGQNFPRGTILAEIIGAGINLLSQNLTGGQVLGRTTFA